MNKNQTCFQHFKDYSRKAGKATVALKGFLYQPAGLGKEEPTGSSNNNDDTDRQLSNVTGLQLTILSAGSGMKNVLLPWPPKGAYYFDSTDALRLGKYLSIREEGGKWKVHCTKPAFIRDERGEVRYEMDLLHGGICRLENAGDTYTLFTEFSNKKSNIFHNYRIDRFTDITIGRTSENDIQYANSFVSRHHATLRWEKNNWTIRDTNSSYGLFVNNRRVKEAALAAGDSVFIMGLRINIGIGFISINDENQRFRIISGKVGKIDSPDQIIIAESPTGASVSDSMFNRFPRRRAPFEPQKITIENPPASLSMDSIPLLLRMGSSMVMGSTALLAGNIAMMLTTLMFPLLTTRYTDKQKKEYEEKRTSVYTKYLRLKKLEIQKEKQYEESVLNRNYPPISKVLDYTKNRKSLWERRNVDDDFLSLRLGSGSRPLVAEFDYQERMFGINQDPLEDAMYELAEKPVFLDEVPIMLSMIKDRVCGILGERDLALAFAGSLIMQTVLLHSYDEVKLIVIIGEKDLHRMEFLRYLPHIWNDSRDMRFLATTEGEAYQISEHLKKEIEGDLENRNDLDVILKRRPYYLVFAFDKRVFDGMEVLKVVMQSERNIGISVMSVFDDLPKDCSKIIHLTSNGQHWVQHLKKIEIEDERFQADDVPSEQAEKSMRILANTSLKTVSLAYSLPKTLTFLEMFGVGKVEQLNIARNWKENNPVKSMAVPIGVGTVGDLFYFDIHEKYHGPHGLVAGMTGSGKSEFIITYILSLAVNFHPDEVSFVLIDYKGGGLAGAFEDEEKGIHLPHVVGTITNLDGSAIQRSLLSIQSELTRRQRIFNDAKSHTAEGTMDIYTYQKLYRQGLVSEPLPHLLIISDEFAELKQQEPDFMERLISAARIGRSLGVHLILATQKPAGVVDDQIWSNTKFRVCLRVQDRNDSYDMIRRPEAAELKDTGRFYLQVGYNEYFALGQSGYCGADYEPSEDVIVIPDNEVQIIDPLGQVIGAKKPARKKNSSGIKQIVAIVKEISRIAEEDGFQKKPLWKEELPKHLGLEDLPGKNEDERKAGIGSWIGYVDDPSRQNQFPLYLNLQQCRNLLIAGESGSGKTTMLQTILYDVVMHYSPEEVNYYIMDFSSRNLSLFRGLPHCGAFVTDEDAAAVTRVFDLLQELIEERRKQFAEAEVSSFDAYLEVEKIPLVLFVIDNVTRFEEFDQSRDTYDILGNIMNSGVGYGVKVLYSVSQINDCPLRLRREAGHKIALRERDRYVYTDILDCRCTYEPYDTPGRGICVVDGECYEFQTALCRDITAERERAAMIRRDLKGIEEQYRGYQKAKRIAVLKDDMTYEEFAEGFMPERIPIGIQIGTLKKVAVPLQQLYCTSLYFGNDRGASLIMRNLLLAMKRENAEILAIKRLNSSLFESGSPLWGDGAEKQDLRLLECTQEGVGVLLERIKSTILRNREYRDRYCEEHGIQDWRHADAVRQWRREVRKHSPPLMVILESMADIVITMSTDAAGTLSSYLSSGEGFHMYFWACYYPDDAERIELARFPEGLPEEDYDDDSEDSRREKRIRHNEEGITESFNKAKFSLLAGGRFDQQKLLVLPSEYEEITNICSERNDNKLLLHYHGNLYHLFMPCGDMNRESGDPDEQDIL